MDSPQPTYDELLQSAIDKFWHVIPPIWRHTHSHTHQIASEMYEITGAQFAILRAIHNGKQSVSDLASFGHISRPAISRTVESLVNSGLVSRQRNPEDRRQVWLSLTEGGRALLRSLHDETHTWMGRRLKQLDAAELEMVTKALDLIDSTFN